MGHSCHPSLSFSAPRTFQEWRDRATPLASHIFVSRRVYQKKSDTKNEKRHHSSALLSWQQACDLGLRGDLDDRLPRGRGNSLEEISGRHPAVRAAVTSRWTQPESFNSWVMGTMLDPQLQFISKTRQLAPVARRNFVGITCISDDPGSDRHRSQVSCDIVIVSLEQGRREGNGGVNLLAAGHVFLERIVQVEGVVVGKRDFGDVAVNDLDICRLQSCRRLAGDRRQISALLDSGEVAVGKGGSDEAELAGAAADVEDAGAGDGGEEFRRFGGNANGGPLEAGELSNPGRIDLVELVVFDGPGSWSSKSSSI